MSATISATRVATLVGEFDRSPAYLGLAEALRLLIGDGRISLDVRLPSERSLTAALDVSRTTVTRAYAELCESGYAEARRGSGTRTRVPGGRSRAHDRALLPMSADPDVIDLNCAAPSAPPGVAAAYAEAVRELPAYLSGTGYFPLGVDGLREAIAESYARRGVPTSPGQIMVTPGALSAATVIAQALTRPGDRVVVESPTYPNATQALATAGARLVPAPVDPGGWDLDAMVATVRHSSARVTYLIPDFQNPTGHLMGDAEREALASSLSRARTVAVIDEAHQALALDPGLAESMPRPFAAYAPDAVTIGSASKSHWGGLRLGWIRAQEETLDALVTARVGLDLGCPVVDQLALAHLLADDGELLAHHRARLAEQRAALAQAVTDLLPEWRFVLPSGGLALWCELPRPGALRLVQAAQERGAVVAPGSVFAVEGGLDRFVRIPWTQSPDALRTAVQRIAAAWADLTPYPSAPTAETNRVLIA